MLTKELQLKMWRDYIQKRNCEKGIQKSQWNTGWRILMSQ